MPSEFVVNIDVDLAIPDFMDASVPLEQIAERVKTEAQENIRQQRSPDGTSFFPLAKKTISRKGFSMALFDKGIMFRALHVYQLAKNQFEVGIIPRGKPRRDLVGMIHQEIGVPSKKGNIIRPFLGFSQKTLKWANTRMERWLAERTQKAAKKFINLKY